MADHSKIAQQIAAGLGETEKIPKAQILRVVQLCGEEFAQLMLETSKIIHADDGIKTEDGSRNRTLGGVYFYLARGALPYDMREQIFPDRRTRMKKRERPAIKWKARTKVFKSVLNKPKGEVIDVHITVNGRPLTTETKDATIIATLAVAIDEYQSFPTGVPQHPADETTFFVYIAEKQWKKHVGNRLEKDVDASIFVEGVPMFDGEMGGIAIFARTIKVRSGAANRKEASRREKARESHRQTELQQKQAAEARRDEADVEVPDDLPPELAKKLRPLYGARQLFQKRLADIEALPLEKQSGLKAAKMALERTEQQIAALEAKARSDTDA